MYRNPEKLAEILGIPKLPEFTREEFGCPLDEIRDDRFVRFDVLSRVNEHLHPPAGSEELLTVIDLFKMGMHYVQHKTSEKVERNFNIRPGIRNSKGELEDNECAFVLNNNSYLLTDKRLAAFIESTRDSGKVMISPHAPRIALKEACDIVIAGAEEAHHAITYKSDPEFYAQSRTETKDSPLTEYFKDELELEFGKFLPNLIGDFNFTITPIHLITDMDHIRGNLSRDEFTQLYRERLEAKYGFTLPGNDDTQGLEK